MLVKAAARRAPLPSLTSQPAVPDLITDPREDCLIRDFHRCIITHAFDFDEAVTRHKERANEAKDDEGRPLFGGNRFLHLEAAPIVPHSLAEIGSDPSEEVQSGTKKLTLAILNIFDHGIQDIINECVGTPRNAVTLTKNYHHMFAEFEIYFTQHDGLTHSPHTYKIEAFVPLAMRSELPITRTLRTEGAGKSIALPEPRLLAVRRALAHVLYYSSVGTYIDDLLEKLKEKPTEENEATDLDLFAELRLDGRCASSSTTTTATTAAANTAAADSIVAADTAAAANTAVADSIVAADTSSTTADNTTSTTAPNTTTVASTSGDGDGDGDGHDDGERQ